MVSSQVLKNGLYFYVYCEGRKRQFPSQCHCLRSAGDASPSPATWQSLLGSFVCVLIRTDCEQVSP